MQTDGILFDLDGTLWDAVSEHDLLEPGAGAASRARSTITEDELRILMGKPWMKSQTAFSKRTATKELLAECMAVENAYLQKHGARLYPDVVDTLQALHKEYPLYIVSNCQCGYIDAFLHAHQLEGLFDGFLCFGDTFASKGENIKALVQHYNLQAPVYVGDTQGDKDAAAYAGVPFIYATYGFGLVSQFDGKIDVFGELLPMFSRLRRCRSLTFHAQ